MDLKEVDLLGPEVGGHWYYASKASAMLALLGQTKIQSVVDVGAGSGFFASFLLQHTRAMEAWCIDTSYVQESDVMVAGKPFYFRRHIDQPRSDLMLFMDVIEHVEHDIDFLRSYVARAPSGTRVLVSVPAFQFLWSGHDRYLGHQRRYTLSQLDRVTQAAGLRPLRSHYYFAAVFPIVAMTRLARKALRRDADQSQLVRHHPVVNRLLAQLCRVERPWMGLNRLGGLTAFSLSYKP